MFHWVSQTNQAACSNCGTISNQRLNLYDTRRIQDLPISGMTVYHFLRVNRYSCNNPVCINKMFVEQFPEIAEKDSTFTIRLKDLSIRMALESSCHATSKKLKEMGAHISTNTVNRAVKKRS